MGSERTVHDFDVRTSTGDTISLGTYAGQVLLIVNVASRCGYTPQYAGLERLYRRYSDRGFLVLGFPCNQFGGQEPGPDDEIQAFCDSTYGITFPVFAKVRVNGPDADPLFAFLTSRKKGWMGVKRIAWNFTKFLVDRKGMVLARFGTRTKPDQLDAVIERAFGA
jgi:glutathione peroxidase